MTTNCPKCGLPKDLCVCETIAKESQKITIYIDRKKFGKKYTVVEGIDTKEINIKDLGKGLKSKLACGGTTKDGIIELQGEHTQRVMSFLVEMGFAPETIQIIAEKRRRRENE